MTESKDNAPRAISLGEEIPAVWRQLPHRGALAILLVAWVAVFQFLGNSTLGYVNTTSLFGWWQWTMKGIADQEISYLIPIIVLVLLWCRRDELLKAEKSVWWPAVGILLLAIVTHFVGYMIQQARLSVVAFFFGVYGLIGLLWGRSWLRMAFFPFFLFAFCIPLGAGLTEKISVPMRLIASQITSGVSGTLLGIDVVRNGTQLADASGTYQYEVAAACSGLRSLTAIVALGFTSIVLRMIGLQAIVPFTLKIMSDVVRDAFMHVQRFSTDWHANSFAGSTVRKITRGMWALDLYNDTILLALLPSLMVLLGSMACSGCTGLTSA